MSSKQIIEEMTVIKNRLVKGLGVETLIDWSQFLNSWIVKLKEIDGKWISLLEGWDEDIDHGDIHHVQSAIEQITDTMRREENKEVDVMHELHCVSLAIKRGYGEDIREASKRLEKVISQLKEEKDQNVSL